MSRQTEFAKVNGVPLCYEQAGSGPPLVLLHGFGLDMRMWDDQFLRLVRHYRVIRYDLRGFGQSLPQPATPFSHADDLKGLLDYLGIERAHVMGLSLGGMVAVDFALLYPESVGRLLLVDSALGGYRWSAAWKAALTSIWTHGRNGDVAMARGLWLSHPLFEPALLNEGCRDRLQRIVEDYSGWHWVHQGLEQFRVRAAECLTAVQAATLVVIGERDLPDFHAIADLLQRNIPDVRKVELANVGHMSNMEAPQRFNEVVEAYLSESLL